MEFKKITDEVTSFKNERHLWVKLFTEVKRLYITSVNVSISADAYHMPAYFVSKAQIQTF